MNRLRLLLGTAGALALAATLAPDASARSTIAWAGAPNPLTARSCFTESYGRATNSGCSSQQTWEIALPIEAAGTWNVTVDVTPTSDPSSVSCMAFGISQDGGSYWASLNIAASQPSVPQTLKALTVDVPGGGALYVGCFLKQGASVNGVNWKQPLQVSLNPQVQSNWCWAAGTQMIAGYEGVAINQCDEANHANNRTDCCTNAASASDTLKCNQGGWPDFGFYGFNATTVYQFGTSNPTASYATLQNEFAANRPVGFAWHWNGGGGHYMVATDAITDENGVQYVTINDPWAPNVGEQVTILYSEWVSGSGTTATATGGYTHWRDDYGISKKN